MNSPVRIKLDENLGCQAAELLRAAGHEVTTVHEEGLVGASDEAVANACGAEGRCLVTLDLGFSNPFLFPPAHYAGIAVLRVPGQVTAEDVADRMETLIRGLSRSEIRGKLWIVQKQRIREYIPREQD